MVLSRVRCKKNPFLVQRVSEQVKYKCEQDSAPKSPSMDNKTKGDRKPKTFYLKNTNSADTNKILQPLQKQ